MLRVICDRKVIKTKTWTPKGLDPQGDQVYLDCSSSKSACPKESNRGAVTLFCFKATDKER